jgi:hypothetical protein
MVERVGADVGWAEYFFTTVYTRASNDREVEARVKAAYNSAYAGDPEQVFPVPLTPLELLVSSPATAGLVSDETVFIANNGLWRVRMFNEFVRMQAEYNARVIGELHEKDLPDNRREAIAEGSVWISRMLHVFGVDEANAPGGWYARLKDALDADIDRLTDQRAEGFLDYGEARRWFLLGDLGMAALVVVFAVTLVVGAICG